MGDDLFNKVKNLVEKRGQTRTYADRGCDFALDYKIYQTRDEEGNDVEIQSSIFGNGYDVRVNNQIVYSADSHGKVDKHVPGKWEKSLKD